MSIKDKVQGNGTRQKSAGVAGGDEMAIALSNGINGQLSQMQKIIQASELSLQRASDQMADYLVQVGSGQRLLALTLEKASQQAAAAAQVETVAPSFIDLELPQPSGFGAIRQGFLNAFGAGQKSLPNPFEAQGDEQ